MVGSCEIDRVYFDVEGEEICASCTTEKKTVYEGDPISLVVETSGCADGSPVKFEVYQNVLWGDNVLREEVDYSEGVTISGDKADVAWTAEWVDDIHFNGGDDSPEYWVGAYVDMGDHEEYRDSRDALILWNVKVRESVGEGYIKEVKVKLRDTASLGWLFRSDEVDFEVTVENTGTAAHNYEIQIWDAMDSDNVLCEDGEPSASITCAIVCYKVSLNPGSEKTAIFTTNWRAPCSLNNFKGISIIKLLDGEDVVDEK